jgi:hypothetical protein
MLQTGIYQKLERQKSMFHLPLRHTQLPYIFVIFEGALTTLTSFPDADANIYGFPATWLHSCDSVFVRCHWR